MFETVDSIYEFIGQEMFNSLPDEWVSASNYTLLENFEKGIISQVNLFQRTKSSNEEAFRFAPSKVLELIEAYKSLYQIMQSSNTEAPWNKARFQITSEGDFEIDFKYDENFEWYRSLDIDSKEYDDLDIDIINQIKSWEGLPDDAPRYWNQ